MKKTKKKVLEEAERERRAKILSTLASVIGSGQGGYMGGGTHVTSEEVEGAEKRRAAQRNKTQAEREKDIAK
jgi:hypothetical protein